jgi:two-component system, NarL family, sensor histidine kinase DesK
MNWPKLRWPSVPTGSEKPSWAGLLGCASMAYVLVELYLRGGSWQEWVWTSVVFVIFFGLCILAAMYWSQQKVMQVICLAIGVLAAAFTTYQPTGVYYFIFVAAFGPLAVGGRFVGSALIVIAAVMLIQTEWRMFWPPSFVPHVASVQAVLIGSAITFVARQQIAVRRIVKTAERERIARDLHDILGHTLSVVILKSELAHRLMDQDPQRARREIEDVERISRRALAEVREAIAGYGTADQIGEIERAKATLETAGIRAEHQVDPVDIPAAHERVLALVVREAITNVVRHAAARHCRVTLERIDSGYRLQVRDDGRGGIDREGMGMRGIRERIAAIGGNVAWKVGVGTELIVTVPTTSNTEGIA